MAKFKITAVVWDNEVDGELVPADQLPKPPFTVEADDENEAIDRVSDQTGFCIKSAFIRRL